MSDEPRLRVDAVNELRRARAARKRPGTIVAAVVLVTVAAVVAGAIFLWPSRETERYDETGSSVGPVANRDHWHAAFGIQMCGEWLPNPPDGLDDPYGIHTHADGLIHIHPFDNSVAGPNATLAAFLEQVGIEVDGRSVTLSDGTTIGEDTECDGRPASMRLWVWDSPVDAAGGQLAIVRDDPEQVVFSKDEMVVAIIVAPDDEPTAELPPSVEQLEKPFAAETSPMIQLDHDGVEGGRLGQVVEPAAMPQYADGSAATINGGVVDDPSKEIVHQCDWTTDVSTALGVELTLELTSVGRVIVGVKPARAFDGQTGVEIGEDGSSFVDALSRAVEAEPPVGVARRVQSTRPSDAYTTIVDLDRDDRIIGVQVVDTAHSPLTSPDCH